MKIFFLLLTLWTQSSAVLATEHLKPELRDGLPPQVCYYLNNLPKIERRFVESDATKKSGEIVRFLKALSPKTNRQPVLASSVTGKQKLEQDIFKFVSNQEEITMHLPAFPFKSLNTERKVLSFRVDLGELVGLLTLNHICCEIGTIHIPGSLIYIISDGIAFRSLFPITAEEYCSYQMDLAKIAHPFSDHVRLILPSGIAYHQFLEDTIHEPIIPEASKIKDLGIFAEEEMRSWRYEKGKIAERAQRLGYELAVASERFQRFLNTYLPPQHMGIRLSVHAQDDISKKIGISMVYGSMGTPWHQAPVLTRETVILKKYHRVSHHRLNQRELISYLNQCVCMNVFNQLGSYVFLMVKIPSMSMGLIPDHPLKMLTFMGVKLRYINMQSLSDAGQP